MYDRAIFENRSSIVHNRTISFGTIVFLFILAFLSNASESICATHYVDPTIGNDSNIGLTDDQPIKTLREISERDLSPGDQILLKRGSVWNEGITITSSGEQGNPIVFSAYGVGPHPTLRYMKIKGNYITISELNINRNKENGDAIQVKGTNCILKNLIIQNGTRDGIDASNADHLLIESCHIHHFLKGSFADQEDAHGIVVGETQGITVRNTEIHHVSGDCFQVDPNRNADDLSTDISIENCHFWTGPLTKKFNDGWVKTSHLPDAEKQCPGENAVDTKVLKTGWENAPRMKLRIVNTKVHGWKEDAYIANKAAFNLKEKIDAVVNGVTVYDSQIGFRLRGRLGNANVYIKNSVIYNCKYALRTEDDLENLKVFNSTFGKNIHTIHKAVASSTGFSTWSVKNNAFLGSKPEIASHASNVLVSSNEVSTNFTDVAASDYHLSSSSKLIDKGETIQEVEKDLDGNIRKPMYDVGAYEYTGTSLVSLLAPTNLTVIDAGTDLGNGDSKSHFQNETQRLASTKALVFSADFGSQVNIDKFCYGDCSDVTYDSIQNGARFRTGGGQLDPSWPASTSGKVYIQFETKFDANWSYIDHKGGTTFRNAKFTRPRQDSIKTSDTRSFDFQIRMYGKVDRGTPGSDAGLPTVRCYVCSPAEGDDPLRAGDDLQPGGVPAYYFYPTNKWIRETYEVDLGTGRIKVWMSDESTDTRLLVADPKNSSLGFPFEPKSDFRGIDAIRLGVNSSSGYPNPSVYYWHRNLIISREPISLNGRPN